MVYCGQIPSGASPCRGGNTISEVISMEERSQILIVDDDPDIRKVL